MDNVNEKTSDKKKGSPSGRRRHTLKDVFELSVTKDGKPRKLTLENHGRGQYDIVIHYPDGQKVFARYQPKLKDGMPYIRYWAQKNGFTPVSEEDADADAGE